MYDHYVWLTNFAFEKYTSIQGYKMWNFQDLGNLLKQNFFGGFINRVGNVSWPLYRDFKGWCFERWPFVRANRGIVGCVWFLEWSRSYTIGGNMATWKIGGHWFNEERLLVPWGLRVPIWKIDLLRLSVVPCCGEGPQVAVCCLEWLGRLNDERLD